MSEMIEVETPNCPECGEFAFISVPKAGYDLWKSGLHIQTALPDLSSNERELLLTGFHPECWDLAFPPEEEEEEYYGVWYPEDYEGYEDEYPEDFPEWEDLI